MGGEWSSPPTTTMSQVYVKTLTGQTITLEVDTASDTVDDLRLQLEGEEGTPVSQQRLVCDGPHSPNTHVSPDPPSISSLASTSNIYIIITIVVVIITTTTIRT